MELSVRGLWSSFAIFALAKLGNSAVPALLAALNSGNLYVREDAVQALAAMKLLAAEAGHALIVAEDERLDLDSRQGAVTSLAEIKPLTPYAVDGLTLALKDQRFDLHSRQAAVDALADLTPLTPYAVDGLMLALKDKSDTIRSAAAKALQDQGGEPGRAALAELKREQLIEAQSSKPDTRSYSKEELIATIQDPNLEYPLSLTYLVPILPVPAPIDEAPFVVTVHAGQDSTERLTFWKKSSTGRYQKLQVMDGDPDNQEHFDAPITCQAIVQVTTAGGNQSEEREFFVEIPVEWYRGGEERVFAVDSDGLHPVEIESPEETVPNPKQIPLKYQTASPSPDLGSYHRLDWSFLVSNEGDAMCCPSGGEVSGTYKIVKDGTKSPPTWKMVVETAKFSGPPAAVRAAKALEGASQLIPELKSSNLQQRRDALQKLSNTSRCLPKRFRPSQKRRRAWTLQNLFQRRLTRRAKAPGMGHWRVSNALGHQPSRGHQPRRPAELRNRDWGAGSRSKTRSDGGAHSDRRAQGMFESEACR